MAIFTIYPYEGYDELKFDMLQEEVEEQAGIPPKIIIDNILHEVYEYREGNAKLTYVDNKLVDVWIPEKTTENKVVLSGQEWLDIMQESTVDALKKNYEFKESKNKKCILFPSLGICAFGCGPKKAKEGKAIIAFSHERLPWFQDFVEVC